MGKTLSLLVAAAFAVPAAQSSPAPFHAPAEVSGSLAVKLHPMENVTTGSPRLVTFGVPFPRGSVTTAALAKVRVLKGGVEVPAFVEQLTPWRHLSNASLDNQSVRIARIQINTTFAVTYPNFETVTVEWGLTNRSQSLPSLTNPRTGWHLVTSGTFVAGDNVWEPDVYAVLPKDQLCKGILRPTRMNPFDAAIAPTRDDPATLTNRHSYPQYLWDQVGAKNFFFSIINEDDPRVTGAGLCPYKDPANSECWLFDRSSAMFNLYFRSGFVKALREAVRSTVYYHGTLDANGFTSLKPGDPKYSYNECLAYAHWLTGDDVLRAKIATVTTAFNGVNTRWSPTANFWTERHSGFKLLAHGVAYEVLGDAYKAGLLQFSGDFIWHQDGAGGALPASRVDGGLWHYGRQHDWDWPENSLGASPWMSAAQPFDAMLRVYHSGEAANVGHWLRRHGTFIKSSILLTSYNGNQGFRLEFPRYAVLVDGNATDPGINGDEWTDPQHALEVASSLAWSYYFSARLGLTDLTLKQKGDSLFKTYDDAVTGWVRPGGPASGLAAFRVSPWRKYNWEYRTSGGFSWAMGVAAPPPNQPPTAALTAPASGATYTAPASIAMTATASDPDGTVSKVEFYNGATKLGEDASSPYSFTWTNVGAGNYSLKARAIDNQGAVGDSASRSVTVTAPGNTPPACSITAPANGSTYTAPAAVTISATASDPGGSIAKVEFFQGSTKLGEDATSPYSTAWTNVGSGTWSLTARATDNQGATGTSAPVSITVNPGDARDNDGDGIRNDQDPDDDNDGIPDTTDPDLDGDGVSNAEEVAAGTDPNDRTSFPAPPPSGDDGDSEKTCGAGGLEALVMIGVTAFLRRRRIT